MNSNIFIQSTIILVIILALIPGLAFCELQILDNDELARVDAMASGLFDTCNTKGDCGTDRKTMFSQQDPNDLKTADTCSSNQECNSMQNSFFPFETHDPVRSFNTRRFQSLPSCQSGGCR